MTSQESSTQFSPAGGQMGFHGVQTINGGSFTMNYGRCKRTANNKR